MMLCDICEKEPATVTVTRTDPVEAQTHLCRRCAGLVCDICERNATFHLTVTDPEGQRRIDLCPSCAKAHKLEEPQNAAPLVHQYGKKVTPP